MTPTFEFHPLCLAFPAYPPDVYAARLADYRAHPERAGDTAVMLAIDEADATWKIADGRHHYRICRELGYEVETQRFTGTPAELAAFVLGRNAHRRHCDPSQIAAAIAAVTTWVRGGDRKSEEIKASRDALIDAQKTQKRAAEEAGISRETLQRAAKVAKEAPELLPVVRDGKLDVKTAAKVADLPAPERQHVADSPDPKLAAKQTIADAKAKAERAAKKAILKGPERPDEDIAKEIGARPQVVADVRKTLATFGRIPDLPAASLPSSRDPIATAAPTPVAILLDCLDMILARVTTTPSGQRAELRDKEITAIRTAIAAVRAAERIGN